MPFYLERCNGERPRRGPNRRTACQALAR